MTRGSRGVRYETLDALRGVAALAVVVFHLAAFNLLPNVAPHAYLAVDFFFVLSGFVVAHAYGDALGARMTWVGFARKRLVRLMPLAVLGASLGLIVLIVKWKMYPGREDPLPNIVLSGLLNMAMLPSFFAGNAYEHGMYPGDGPLWSLWFEILVNLVWAWMAPRLAIRGLVGVVLASAAVLFALSLGHGSTRMGVGPETFFGGLARASFGFFLGVLLYRSSDRFSVRPRRWTSAICAGLLLAAFCGPLLLRDDRPQALAWDFAWIFALLPAVVVLGSLDAATSRLGRFLGEISYPVYVLHWPCLAVFSGVKQRMFPEVDRTLFSFVTLTVAVAFAWAVLRLYDEPVRRRLGRRGSPGPAAGLPLAP